MKLRGEATVFTCPMHPNVQRVKTGICPECGMGLVPTVKKSVGPMKRPHVNKHMGHDLLAFKLKFWLSLLLTIPVLLYSDIVSELFRFKAPIFPGSAYLPLVLSSVIFFYGGLIFISSAIRELKAKMPGMMTLIALAISVAYLYSLAVVLSGGEKTLFWELATLITVMLLGHWLEMRSVGAAQGALKELSKLLPDQAEVVRSDGTELVPLDEVKVNDLVLVKPGGRVPTDGIVLDGASDLNESIVTGESKLAPKKPGSQVIAGTINGDGTLRITVTKIGDETFLAGVVRLVAEAQSSKSRLQILSDRAAYYLTIIAILAGATTLVGWLLVGETAFAFERMVAVLVIACPHALGLAIPLVASISTTKAAKNGFLVKERLSLESARNIDLVLFDKTGTLTKGEFGVDQIATFGKGGEAELLRYAASIESQSEHPIARAIIKEAKKLRLSLLKTENFQRVAGKGAKAKIRGREFFVGSQELLSDLGLVFDLKAKRAAKELSSGGKTVIFVARKDFLIGAIALADVTRTESKEAIKLLEDLGLKVAMITGDSVDVAESVAGELGIDQYFAKVLPAEKSKKVKELQAKGQKVAMVGDGVNDAPALVQADLGIAIGAGTNVAVESAGIILVRDDPRDISKIIKLSRLTYRKMIENLFWAAGYNVVAIPLAAGALAFKGIFLQPAVAAIFMSLSTIVVAINANLLQRERL